MKAYNINYYQIYKDILTQDYPEKLEEILPMLSNKNLNFIDIIRINQIIYTDGTESVQANQKHRSYKQKDVFYILDYQKRNNMNNSQIAQYFAMSRNTIAKWKRVYLSRECGKIDSL